MQHLTVHLGSANPAFFAGRPMRAGALHHAADRPAPPVSGTAARHCAAAHPSGASLPALSGRHARAAHVVRELHARAAGRGQAPRHPLAAWHPTPGTPTFFPPHFPSAALPPSRSRVDSSSRPHSSPTPSLERPSFPTAPLTQTAASDHRQPPLPRGFRLSTAAVRHSPVSSSPSYQSPKFLANPSLPRLSRAAGLHHPRWRPLEPPPRRRTPPPDAIGTASLSTRRSGTPLSSPPCPAPSP
jgi:hypothetical protein